MLHCGIQVMYDLHILLFDPQIYDIFLYFHRCRCIAMSGRMLVYLVGQILVCLMFKQSNMVEPPSFDHLCSFKAPFLMLKTLAFVSSKTWEPASEAARDSHPLEGAEWHDDFPPES